MIDYKILDDSIQHYERAGFRRIESPWTVSQYIDNLTKPTDKPHLQLKHNDKCLVASGEQSFLYLYLKEFLPKGKFQTVTPCFRSDNFDFSHTKYFMKNELIITDIVDEFTLNGIIDDALKFFSKYIEREQLQLVKTDIGWDIEWNGHELGSYGIRKNEFLEWIYGTGCAEPRLGKIISLYKAGKNKTPDANDIKYYDVLKDLMNLGVEYSNKYQHALYSVGGNDSMTQIYKEQASAVDECIKIIKGHQLKK